MLGSGGKPQLLGSSFPDHEVELAGTLPLPCYYAARHEGGSSRYV